MGCMAEGLRRLAKPDHAGAVRFCSRSRSNAESCEGNLGMRRVCLDGAMVTLSGMAALLLRFLDHPRLFVKVRRLLSFHLLPIECHDKTHKHAFRQYRLQ